MGTNYYVRTSVCENACEHCSETELVHLGKSSRGWKFTFRAQTDWEREHALREWLDLTKAGDIETEYGTPVTREELLEFVMFKNHGGNRSHLEYHGTDISGPDYKFWLSFRDKHYFSVGGFEFLDSEFS